MQVWNGFYCQNSTKCPQRPWLPYMETTPPNCKTSNRIHSQPTVYMMILWVVLTVCKCSPHPYVAVPHTTTHLPKPHMVSIYGRCTPCVRHHLKPRCTLHTTTPPTPLMPQPINETSVTQNTTNPIKVVRSYTLFWKSQSNRITPHAPRS